MHCQIARLLLLLALLATGCTVTPIPIPPPTLHDDLQGGGLPEAGTPSLKDAGRADLTINRRELVPTPVLDGSVNGADGGVAGNDAKKPGDLKSTEAKSTEAGSGDHGLPDKVGGGEK